MLKQWVYQKLLEYKTSKLKEFYKAYYNKKAINVQLEKNIWNFIL